MACVAIETVDAGLMTARDGSAGASSPGVALLDPAALMVGAGAAAAARLRPVFAYDRHWSEISTEPLPRPVARARTAADIVHAHLRQLWSDAAQSGDQALLAVPGTLTPRALGLLGGIARAAGIPVAGWVDNALAASAGLEAQETVLHLDLHWYQAVLTELSGVDRLIRRRIEIAPRVGLKALHGAWAQLVAEAMVRRTRFDPLHQASSEQQLHDRLPGWLAVLEQSDAVDVELDGPTGTCGVTLGREQFSFAVEAYFAQLIDLIHAVRRAGDPVTVALSARAATLPGLLERYAQLGDVAVVKLPAAAAVLGALAAETEIRVDGEPALTVSLPRRHPAVRVERASRRVAGETPTHVVHAGRARPITTAPLAIGLSQAAGAALVLPRPAPGVSRLHCTLVREGDLVTVRDHSRYGTFVNGERIDGAMPLAAGDRLRLGTPGILLELIAAAS